MSFLNSIRGLGRSIKKKNKDYEPQGILYGGSAASPQLQRYNGGRLSPQKQKPSNILFAPSSPKKKTRSHRTQLPQQGDVLGAPAGDATGPPPLFLCEPYFKTSLVKGCFKTIVKLPKYVDYGEWMALNIFEMFGHLNLFYGVISEYVTPYAYPTMNAGPSVNYTWRDSSGQCVDLPAQQYIDFVLRWISSKINDQAVFPTRNGTGFSLLFVKDCKNIARQMFRIFAHIYHNHFEKLLHLLLEAHWNSFFAHFISFCKEFLLLERAELAPLLPLVENLEAHCKII